MIFYGKIISAVSVKIVENLLPKSGYGEGKGAEGTILGMFRGGKGVEGTIPGISRGGNGGKG
jgi:hypothetical protein